MARRGRSPKKKKQISINAYTSASKASSSSSSSSARKKSKNDINNGLPTSRTWIYHQTTPSSTSNKTTPTLNNSDRPIRKAVLGEEHKKKASGVGGASSEEGYELYLNKRVQRPVVRSLPCSYSFFTHISKQNDDKMEGEESDVAVAAAGGVGGEGNNINGGAALKTEEEEGKNNVKHDNNGMNIDDKVRYITLGFF